MPILTNRWIVLALLFFARASMAMQFQSIPPISTLLVEELGFNFTQIGLLIGIWMLPGIFIALPGGLLGQRFGDKMVVVSSLGLLTIGALVLANANVFHMAASGRLISGVGAVALNVQLTKMVNDWFEKKEISTSMGILMTAWPFGIALALFTLGHVATIWNWRVAIFLTAGYSFLSLLLIIFLYHEQPSVKPKTLTTRSPLWVISRRELTMIVSAGFVWVLPNAGFIVLMGFMPALLVSNGMEMATAGMLVSLTSWVTVGSIPLGGWLTDLTGRINAFIIGGVILNALIMFLIPMGGSVLAYVLLFGLAMGGWPGAIMALPSQVLSPQGRSTGFGVFYMVYYGMVAALIPIAGWMRDFTGDATASVQFGGVLMVMTLVALIAFRILLRRWPSEKPRQ